LRFIINGTDYQAVTGQDYRGRTRDIAALQAETGWTLRRIEQMTKGDEDHPPLELVGLQIALYLTLRKHGRMITYARAGELLDDVDVQQDPGDEEPAGQPGEGEQEEAGPTPAPTGSDRGDDTAAAGEPAQPDLP
jgi:hypothetical protein